MLAAAHGCAGLLPPLWAQAAGVMVAVLADRVGLTRPFSAALGASGAASVPGGRIWARVIPSMNAPR